MAIAFTRNQGTAVVAYPTALLSLLPYRLRGALFESRDGTGMVIFGRYRPALDVILGFALALILLLTRELIRTRPPGDVIVAVAATTDLAEKYERLGFTRGRGTRIYRVS